MDPTKFTFTEGAFMTKFLYKPLFNVLMLFYAYIPGNDLGVAIVALTLLIKIILHPSYVKTLRSQHDMKKIQPKIDEIKKTYKDDKTKQSQELMKVYQEHKVNPLGSCLPLLIQLPILFALYRVFSFGLNNESLAFLYTWFPVAPDSINTIFLAFTGISWLQVDLATSNIYLAVIAGIMQFAQGFLMMRSQPVSADGGAMAQMISKQMTYFFPIVTVFIAMSLPAALALYWVATTFFTVVQQVIVTRSLAKETTIKKDKSEAEVIETKEIPESSEPTELIEDNKPTEHNGPTNN